MKTTAEIVVKADLRDLKRLKKEMGDAFNPRGVKDLDRATGDLDTSFEDAGESARGVADALGDVVGTREGFKQLRSTIRDITNEAKRLNAELSKTQQLLAGAAAGGGGGGGGIGSINPSASGGGGRRRPSGSTPGRGGGTRRGGIMGAAAGALEAIPWAGIALGGMVMMGQSAYGNHLEREKARASTYAARTGPWAYNYPANSGAGGFPIRVGPDEGFGLSSADRARGSGNLIDAGLIGNTTNIGVGGIEGIGKAFGIGPSQAHSSFGQFMSRAGATRGADEFRLAMGLQQSHGIGLGTTGAMGRGFSRMGGGSVFHSQSSQIAKEISAGVTLGLDGSELTKYMDEQSQLLERQLDLGAQALTFDKLHAEERRMGSLVGGYMGGRITRGFAQGVSEMGYKGAGGATELQLARAAGYTPGSGVENYFKALQKMQDIGSNPELLRDYLAQYMGKKGDKATVHQRTALIQRALSAIPGMGNIHADTARRIADGEAGGLDEILGSVGALQSARGIGADLAVEAGFANKKADIGEKLNTTMQDITQATLSVMNATATFAPLLRAAALQIKVMAKIAEKASELGFVEKSMEAMEKVINWIDHHLGM